jgi:hypothetical protein
VCGGRGVECLWSGVLVHWVGGQTMPQFSFNYYEQLCQKFVPTVDFV